MESVGRHTLTQADLLAAASFNDGVLLMPRARLEEAPDATYALAASTRSAARSAAGVDAGRHSLKLQTPRQRPEEVLSRIGLVESTRAVPDSAPETVGARYGVYRTFQTLGLAAATFKDDRDLDRAKNELLEEFEFVSNFSLALPSRIAKDDARIVTGRRAPARLSWPKPSEIQAAHQRGIRGHGVTIGVLDTGIDADHVEFKDLTVPYRYFSLNPRQVPPRDVRGFDPDGHGTHVCGIAAGARVGVAPEADLIVGSVIESETARTSIIRITAGLDWMLSQFASGTAATRPALLNMSLGLPHQGIAGIPEAEYRARIDVMQRIVRQLVQANVAPIVAIGNDGPGAYGYPGGFSEVIAVGAVDFNGRRAAFSGSTPDVTGLGKPDIYGYGVDVFSAFERDLRGAPIYRELSGTSMATPYVAGIAALILSNRPSLSAADLKGELLQQAHPGSSGEPIAGFKL